jgi:5'(3')-deoxyribonucleotidase
MVNQITIALDLDSVLADVMYTWVEEYNIIFNTSIKKQDIIEWHIHNILPQSEVFIHNLFTYVWKNRWKDIPPTSNDISTVTYLLQNAGFRISIITKRDRATISFVSNWLDLHNIYFDDIVFILDNSSKAYYPFFLLVDDSPYNAVDILYPRKIVIFDQPWNKTLVNYTRIYKLNELFNLI